MQMMAFDQKQHNNYFKSCSIVVNNNWEALYKYWNDRVAL